MVISDRTKHICWLSGWGLPVTTSGNYGAYFFFLHTYLRIFNQYYSTNLNPSTSLHSLFNILAITVKAGFYILNK